METWFSPNPKWVAVIVAGLKTLMIVALLPSLGFAFEGRDSAQVQCPVQVVANDVIVTDQERTEVAYHVLPAGIIPDPGQWPYFAWSDTSLGVVRSRDGSGYLFFGSDGGCHENCSGANQRGGSITRSQGTLDHPLGEPLGDPEPPVYEYAFPVSANLPDYVDYAGGGPVYRVPEGEPGAGSLLMVYHIERPVLSGIAWSSTGLARSSDEGFTWQDLGLILTFSRPYDPQSYALDMGEGTLVVATDPTSGKKYFYTYFEEFYWLTVSTLAPGSNYVAVARAPYEDLLAAAFMEDPRAVPRLFHKYYEGLWGQPGLGGRASDLFANGQGNGGQPKVFWSAYRNRFVMIMDNGNSIAYGESIDGLRWPPMQTLVASSGSAVYGYAAAVGLEADPNILGETFYSYYTAWPLGTSWQPATLNRLTITAAGCGGDSNAKPFSTVQPGANGPGTVFEVQP